MSHISYYKLSIATLETLMMVVSACLLALLLGLPLALILYVVRPNGLWPCAWIYQPLSTSVNILRSVPFVILLVLLLPVTHFVVGTSIGAVAAIIPLSIAATPFIAKIIQNVFEEIPQGLIESGLAMGASAAQIMWRMVLPEALPGIINAITVTAVTLVGYAAMAGAIISGGLGELAINYGYQRFNISVMAVTVLLLVVLVQCIQMLGDFISRRLLHV